MLNHHDESEQVAAAEAAELQAQRCRAQAAELRAGDAFLLDAGDPDVHAAELDAAAARHDEVAAGIRFSLLSPDEQAHELLLERDR